jgi:ribosomal protein L24E
MKCTFCGSDIKKGTGIMYASIDGNVSNFCSRRCMKYFIMGKDHRKYKWSSQKK